MRREVKLAENSIGAEEIAAAVKVLESGRVTSGAKVCEFERAFAVKYGFEHCVAVNSGSSANLLAVSALRACGAWTGGSVIVPAVTWPTSVWPLVQCGLHPLVVDVDAKTWCLDPVEARWAVKYGAKGVLPVHVYGNRCDLEWVGSLPSSFVVVEDCCEAQGTHFASLLDGERGAHIGDSATCATFSFYFSHHMTTLEGGAVCTNDGDLAEELRMQRAHGWARDLGAERMHAKHRFEEADAALDPAFAFYTMGYNFRMTELQAAIGLVQLCKVDGFNEARRSAWRAYRERFAEFDDVLSFQEATEGSDPAWFGFGMMVHAPFDRTALRAHLIQRGIESRPIIAGNIARQPAMRHLIETGRASIFGSEALPAANAICERAFSIGCHQAITMNDIDYVYDAMRAFFAERGQ